MPPRANPRQHFDQEAIDDLADSIATHGILQPIVVLKRESGFEILAGERRYRAARQAGLQLVPVVVKDELDERTVAELRLIENIQREDLDAIELAQAYQTLLDEHDLTQEALAKHLGKSRTGITNQLRLLSLPPDVGALVSNGELAMGHARALLGLTSPADCSAVAQQVVEQGLSVRQVEQLVRERMTSVESGASAAGASSPVKRKNGRASPHIRELEDNLARLFGAAVEVRERGARGA